MAVADGVGGWESKGVDSGLYSKKLCLKIGNNYLDNNKFAEDVKALIVKSAEGIEEVGSATIVVLGFE